MSATQIAFSPSPYRIFCAHERNKLYINFLKYFCFYNKTDHNPFTVVMYFSFYLIFSSIFSIIKYMFGIISH